MRWNKQAPAHYSFCRTWRNGGVDAHQGFFKLVRFDQCLGLVQQRHQPGKQEGIYIIIMVLFCILFFFEPSLYYLFRLFCLVLFDLIWFCFVCSCKALGFDFSCDFMFIQFLFQCPGFACRGFFKLAGPQTPSKDTQCAWVKWLKPCGTWKPCGSRGESGTCGKTCGSETWRTCGGRRHSRSWKKKKKKKKI